MIGASYCSIKNIMHIVLKEVEDMFKRDLSCCNIDIIVVANRPAHVIYEHLFILNV